MRGRWQGYVSAGALFFEPVGILERHFAGEKALFHADHEHHGKLQALGRVQQPESAAFRPAARAQLARQGGQLVAGTKSE